MSTVEGLPFGSPPSARHALVRHPRCPAPRRPRALRLPHQKTIAWGAPFSGVLPTPPPVRFHPGRLVLHVGEQPAKARCASAEPSSGPPPPPPPRPPFWIRQQTLGPP